MELFDFFNQQFDPENPERWRIWFILGFGILGLAAFITLLWWVLFADYKSQSSAVTTGGSGTGNDGATAKDGGSVSNLKEKSVSGEVSSGRGSGSGISSASGKDASGKDASGKDASGKDASGKDASGKEASGKDASGKDASGKDASGKDASGKDASGKDASSKDASSKDASASGITSGKISSDTSGGRDFGGSRDYSGLAASAFAGESVASDGDLGVLYKTSPDSVDDLTEIKGVGGATQKELNKAGVYRFKQIANWDERNAAKFGERLDFPGRIEEDEWIPQAKRLAKAEEENANAVEEPEPDLPSDVDYVGLEKSYEGEDSLRVDHKLGLIFGNQANCEDDLTKVSGIGKVLGKKLNETGVYRFQQIADWNDYNVWSFNRIISFPGRIQRDEWISQAKELAKTSHCLVPGKARVTSADLKDIIGEEFEGEDVEVREPFGIVYKSAPDLKDNLQDIKGVGPVLEKKLHEFGVYRFKQIANWPDPAIDEFQDQLSFPDRIRRDNWVAQCMKLARGEKPS